MEVKFTVTKEERKALVKAVSEITGLESAYQGAPGFEFAVGDYTIDRYGALIYGEGVGTEDVRLLLTGLTERGFVFEGDIDEIAPAVSEQAEAVSDDLTEREGIPDESGEANAGSEEYDGADEGEPSGIESGEGDSPNLEEHGEALSIETETDSGRLTIHMPLSGFTASGFDNLEKLTAAKAWILKRMAEADELPIERDEKYLRFPWFKPDASAVEVDAYSRLIAGLCGAAKTKQRVMATERQLQDGDNEKYKARCFLLSIGFVGEQTKQARKILLAPFSGNGSHRSGNSKRAKAPQEAETIVSGEDTVVPLRCSECPHHCYYSDGQMLTADGDAVDTSKKAPDKYTHYCLAAPSGFRKLKHATDWSGGETPPKWCPLNGEAAADSGEENPEASVIHEDGSGANSAATGGEGGGYSDCLACANSLSEPAENDCDADRLFCVTKQDYVEEDGSCDEFNSPGGAAL